MNLSEALLLVSAGKAVRRFAWHHGIHYIFLETNMGMSELYICQTGGGGPANWPLFLRRGDWLAQDWTEIDPADYPKPISGQSEIQQTTNAQAETQDQPQQPDRPAPRQRKAKPKAARKPRPASNAKT